MLPRAQRRCRRSEFSLSTLRREQSSLCPSAGPPASLSDSRGAALAARGRVAEAEATGAAAVPGGDREWAAQAESSPAEAEPEAEAGATVPAAEGAEPRAGRPRAEWELRMRSFRRVLGSPLVAAEPVQQCGLGSSSLACERTGRWDPAGRRTASAARRRPVRAALDSPLLHDAESRLPASSSGRHRPVAPCVQHLADQRPPLRRARPAQRRRRRPRQAPRCHRTSVS
jgi:hypothetical protein